MNRYFFIQSVLGKIFGYNSSYNFPAAMAVPLGSRTSQVKDPSNATIDTLDHVIGLWRAESIDVIHQLLAVRNTAVADGRLLKTSANSVSS